MIDKINIRALFIILLPIIVISSCVDNQVNGVIQEDNNIEAQQKLVSEDLAIYTAAYFANEVNFSYQNLTEGVISKRKGESKDVENVFTLTDKNQNAALYLINYEGGGFVVISGDKTIDPILAYSDKNYLPSSKNEEIPGGLAIWLTNNVISIEQKREEGNFTAESDMDREWKLILNSDPNNTVAYSIEPDDPGCTPTSSSVSPLLQTTWGQADGYNNYAPYLGCSYPYNGRAYSGCVATAMIQVIRYHESPYNWYNWSAMPNTYGNNAVSELMHDAGASAGMDWGCNASSAQNDDIVPALRNTFGYNSATQIGYDGTSNYNDVRDDLDEGLPVIFTGFEKEYVLGFPVPGEGHAWVADGYVAGRLCPSGNSYLKFHMNWGWNGSYNGYYAFNNFNPGSSDYDFKSKVIVNIEP